MHNALQRLLAWALLACLPLIAACGGGGGGSDAPTTTVTGVALIAPISGAEVQIHQLTPGGAPGALLGVGTTGADGSFSVTIPASAATAPLLVTVSGRDGAKYLSPAGGAEVPFGPGEVLRSVADSAALSPLTVSPLTEAAYQKLQQILTENPQFATAGGIGAAVNLANNRIGGLNGVDNILAQPAGDAEYQASLLIIDRMIQNAKTADPAANSTTVLRIINRAYASTSLASAEYLAFQQALNTASQQVLAANPGNAALISAVTLVQALAAAPPAEPDFADVTPPTTPRNLGATASALSASAASVRLAWVASTDSQLAGYEVFRDGVKIATVLSPGYTDTQVSFNVSYSYFVVAFDAAGNRSAASNTATVTSVAPPLTVVIGGQVTDLPNLPFVDNVRPSVPVTLSAFPTATGPATSSILVAWSASLDNVGVAGYDLFRNGVKIATVTGLSFTDAGLASNVSYSYTVIAFDAAGNRSAAAGPLSITPALAPLGVTVSGQVNPGGASADNVSPTPPVTLSAFPTALSATTSSVLLTWSAATDNVGVAGYDVFRDGVKIASVAGLSFTDPSVASNVSYSYTVAAFDAAGNRSPGRQVTITPLQAPLGITVSGQVNPGGASADNVSPTPPVTLSAFPTALTANTSSVLLTWSPAADNVGVAGYDVFRDGVKIASVATLSYTDPSVASSVSYSYRVAAFDAAGNRSPAREVTITPLQAPLGITVSGQVQTGTGGGSATDNVAPAAPVLLAAAPSALTGSTSSVALSWSAASDNVAVTGYDLFRDGVKVATVSGLSYTDPSLASGVAYRYRLVAFDAAGNRSPASNEISVTPPVAPLGVTIGGQVQF